MEPTSEPRAPEPAPEPTPAHPEPALLSDTAPAARPGESGAVDSSEPEAPSPGETPGEAMVRPAYGAFRLPEGVTLDAEQLAPAAALFAESGLSQEQAQKFVDLALARESAAQGRATQAFVDLQNRWVSEVKADPDIGGERLKESLATAAQAIDRLAVPGLREALNLTGAGNHPAIVKAFVRLGQMMAEDRFRPGRPAAPATPRSPAEVIYDTYPRS